jgi:hypothetical protein
MRPVRFVNTVLAKAGADTPVAADQPLLPSTNYDLLINIGARHSASLLPASDADWPADQLPRGDLRLRAVLCLDGSPDPLVESMTLPERGDSFTCSCSADSAHEEWCRPRAWVRFTFTTPVGDGSWGGELIIYYETVAVHAQRLLLPLGEGRAAGTRAILIYRLTKSFANLGDLDGRTASILVAPDHARVIVNGLSFVDNPIAVESNAADQAARAGRDLLYDIHLNTDGTSRYSEGQRKSQAAFEADLRLLARAGAEIYERLFADESAWRTLPTLIRHEARARTLPAVLCVAEPTSVQQRGGSIPWSLVYDLPIGADPSRYQPCDSIRLFGPEESPHDIPAHCPISDHTDESDVLCPFGFWGLSCLIEQPPSADRDAVRVVTTDQTPVSLLMACGSGLDTDITSRHVSTLKTRLGQALSTKPIDNTAALAAALAQEAMDIAYLYCHCGYQKLSNRAVPSPFLRFGEDLIGPLDIANWARSSGWPRPHWPKRKPLVILNGCHTVEMTSGTLSTFVSAFVNRAGAAGVLGTEVTIEQDLAGLLGEIVLDQLAGGASIGAALRSARWQLINLGNVMGLAYTPFCLSGLRLRNIDEEHAA